jgi:hypothetical protein
MKFGNWYCVPDFMQVDDDYARLMFGARVRSAIIQ